MIMKSAVIVTTVIFLGVDEKACLSLGEEVYGRQLENHSSSDKEPGPG